MRLTPLSQTFTATSLLLLVLSRALVEDRCQGQADCLFCEYANNCHGRCNWTKSTTTCKTQGDCLQAYPQPEYAAAECVNYTDIGTASVDLRRDFVDQGDNTTCPWETANIPCKNDTDCTAWLTGHDCGNISSCGPLSEWCQWCKGNGFCHVKPPSWHGGGKNGPICGCY